MGQKESLLAMTKDIIPVPSHVYVDGMWVTKEPKQVSIADEGLGSPPHLKFVTYNVWFEHHFFELRAQKLRDVLRECDADVICLQEVTREFLQGLVATEWVRAHYVVSDVEGDSIHGYGVVMLVKKEFHPLFRFRSFPTQQGRRALVADLHVPGLSDPLRVCTAHFESLNPSVDYRKVQFEIVFMDVASEAAHAVVMGDFNMDPSWALEQQHVPAAYVDAWVATHDASQAGYTMTAFAEFPAWRPDRALLRSPVLAVTSCTLLGTEDIGSACTVCAGRSRGSKEMTIAHLARAVL